MKDKAEILDKIKKSRLSVAEISKICGVSASTVYKWMDGTNDPTYEKLILVDNFLDSNINNYTQHRRDLKNTVQEPVIDYYQIGANAGTPATGEVLPVHKNERNLIISDLFKGSQYAIRIAGNSMMPNYPPGSIIGIREIEDKVITPGSVYVVEKANDLWIKRLYYKNDSQDSGMFELISDNNMKVESGARAGKLAYPPFELDISKVRRLFKVTGIFKPNELTVIE